MDGTCHCRPSTRGMGPPNPLSDILARWQQARGRTQPEGDQASDPGAKASECAAAAPLPQSDQDLVADGLESMGLVG